MILMMLIILIKVIMMLISEVGRIRLETSMRGFVSQKKLTVVFYFLGGTDLPHACAHFAFLSDVPDILNHVHVQVPLLCDVATHDHQAGVLGTTPGFAY